MAIAAGVNVVHQRADHPLVRRQHRAEHRNFMSTLHTNQTGQLVAVKGSPSAVLALGSWRIQHSHVEPLTEAAHLAIAITNDRMASEVLRVLGAAYREGDGATAEA